MAPYSTSNEVQPAPSGAPLRNAVDRLRQGKRARLKTESQRHISYYTSTLAEST